MVSRSPYLEETKASPPLSLGGRGRGEGGRETATQKDQNLASPFLLPPWKEGGGGGLKREERAGGKTFPIGQTTIFPSHDAHSLMVKRAFES